MLRELVHNNYSIACSRDDERELAVAHHGASRS